MDDDRIRVRRMSPLNWRDTSHRNVSIQQTFFADGVSDRLRSSNLVNRGCRRPAQVSH